MTHQTIGQRLKFLMDELNLKVRTFASALNVSETNIRNYVNRDSKPSSDILERILQNYPAVNSRWLITGEGEPFISSQSENTQQSVATTKNNYGNNVDNNQGLVAQQQGRPRKASASHSQDDLSTAQLLIEQLRSQLADKERTIQILLGQQQIKP